PAVLFAGRGDPDALDAVIVFRAPELNQQEGGCRIGLELGRGADLAQADRQSVAFQLVDAARPIILVDVFDDDLLGFLALIEVKFAAFGLAVSIGELDAIAVEDKHVLGWVWYRLALKLAADANPLPLQLIVVVGGPRRPL